jgi:hypothetical protein
MLFGPLARILIGKGDDLLGSGCGISVVLAIDGHRPAFTVLKILAGVGPVERFSAPLKIAYAISVAPRADVACGFRVVECAINNLFHKFPPSSLRPS